MSNRFFNPASQWFNEVGLPLVGGTLTFYLTGGTTTPSAPYTDSALTVATANPMPLDNKGRAPTEIFLDPAISYRVVCKNADGSVAWTRDPVVDPAANILTAFRIYNGNPNSNVAGNQGVANGVGASVIWDIASRLIWVCTTTGTAAAAIWVQIGVTLVGAIQFTSVLTPASITASPQADYSPTNLATSAIIRQDATLNNSISGMATGTTGRYVIWENISAFTQTFLDQNTGSAAANRFAIGFNYAVYPGQSVAFWYDSATLRWRLVGAPYNAPFTPPGGRLTLTAATPVMTADVTAAASVIYTPYFNAYINLPNGAGSWYTAVFAEYSQALSDTAKSPSATVASTAYDVFVWNDAGIIRVTRGFAWSVGGGSTTARGTGAGTTELIRDTVNGVMTNRYAITNGPAAGMGVFVGSLITNATNTVDWVCNPAAAAGGGNARVGLWNMYNRVEICATSKETASYSYSGVLRAANGSNSNRITYFAGLNEPIISAMLSSHIYSVNNSQGYNGIAQDATNVSYTIGGISQTFSSAGLDVTATVFLSAYSLLGSHYMQAVELGGAATTFGPINGITHQLSLKMMA